MRRVLAAALAAGLCVSPARTAYAYAGTAATPGSARGVGTQPASFREPSGAGQLAQIAGLFFTEPNPSAGALAMLGSDGFQSEEARRELAPVVLDAARRIASPQYSAELEGRLRLASGRGVSAATELAGTLKKLEALRTVFRSTLASSPDGSLAERIDGMWEDIRARIPAEERARIRMEMEAVAASLGQPVHLSAEEGRGPAAGSGPAYGPARGLMPPDDSGPGGDRVQPPPPSKGGQGRAFGSNPLRHLLVVVLMAAVVAAGNYFRNREAASRPWASREKSFSASEDVIISRGRARLLELQNPDGSWGVGEKGDPVVNIDYMRMPITAIALGGISGLDDASAQARRRGEEYIFRILRADHGELDKKQGEGNNHQPYALGLALSFLLDRLESSVSERDRARMRDGVEQTLANIGVASWRYVKSEAGGTSFQALVLAEGLLRAQRAGFYLPPRTAPASDGWRLGANLLPPIRPIDPDAPAPTRQPIRNPAGRAGDVLSTLVESLKASRLPGGGHSYTLGNPDSSPADSAFRSVGIELLLFRAGASDRERLREAVDLFLRHRAEFEERILFSKTLTHDRERHNWAKYYYYFSVYRVAQALEELQFAGDRDAAPTASRLRTVLLRQQWRDGSWSDSVEITGPAYGTSLALQSLEILKRVSRR